MVTNMPPSSKSTDTQHRSSAAVDTNNGADFVLLYDAKCDICNKLAFNVRENAKEPISLIALSDPEAQQILDEYYPEGWSHDFYVIQENSCRKGVMALPQLAQLVGIRKFATLVGDYAQYKRHSDQCGQEDHDHGERVTHAHTDGASISRRTFTSAISGAALPFAAPLSKLGDSAESRASGNRPPRGLRAHVARIRPDNEGGFDVSVERNQDLVRSKTWQATPEEKNKKKPAEMKGLGNTVVRNAGSTHVSKADVAVIPTHPDSDLEEAIQMSASDDSGEGRMTRYGLLEDRSRYGLSINLARGPIVVDGEPAVADTMSGRISHDVPDPVVDFLQFESSEETDVKTHLNAYIAGLEAFQRYYAEQGNDKMAELYTEITTGMETVAPQFVKDVDGEFSPVQNVIGVSSVPNWATHVESPTPTQGTTQSVTTQGVSCECGCCGASCCTDCGCGCSICLGTEPGCGCGCCIIGCGFGCGCGCCICA